MSNSISGSAAPVPAVSVLQFYGAPARQLKSDAKSAAEQHRAKVRKIRHDTELEAAEYGQILQRKLIERALDPNVDLKLLADITFKLQSRGIGAVRESESDADQKQKGTASDLLDFLSAVSARNDAIRDEGKAVPRIERDEKDITPDIDLSGFIEGDDHE
jgi:hypothetical protein